MEKQEDVSNSLDSESFPLTPKKRVIMALVFLVGLPLSYPTLLPLGLICSSVLLLQKHRKLSLMGLFLILSQFTALFVLVGLNFISIT